MKDIIVVNGKSYYADSGTLVEGQADSIQSSVSFDKIHEGVQKSQTLNRKFVKQPNIQTESQIKQIQQFKRRHDYEEAQKRAQMMNAAAAARRQATNTPAIARFNSSTPTERKVIRPLSNQTQAEDIPAQIHPLQQKANKVQSNNTARKEIPAAKDLKSQAIDEALARAEADSKKLKKARGINRKSFWKNKRFVAFTAGAFASCLALGYLTYINLPNISTKIAAAQAGINAEFPAYKPAGYQLDGLASFDGNSINLSYKSPNSSFAIKQSKSSWDSTALLSNYVSKEWNNNYLTTQEKGITIYTNSGNAAWVNGGIIYTIEGDSQLDNEQIRKIATSFQ